MPGGPSSAPGKTFNIMQNNSISTACDGQKNSVPSHLSDIEVVAQFRDAMADKGIVTRDDIVADGKLHRFHVDGDKKGQRNGWMILHLDGNKPAGAFGCNRRYGNDHKFTWTGKATKPLSPAERRAFRERMEKQRAEREAAEKARHAAAATLAQKIWDEAAECDDHPYLNRKGIQSHGLRVGVWEKITPETGEVRLISKRALLIPIRDTKKRIHSLQAIFPAKIMGGRDKDYLKDGAKEGLFYSIGKPQTVDGKLVIIICEGYATGASIHESTGHAVIVAFDAGNLLPTARVIRERFPDATIVMAADNDRWTLKPIVNPGVTRAREAAKEIGGLIVVPPFAAELGEVGKPGPTDFNDLHVREGLDAVRAVFEDELAEASRVLPMWFVPKCGSAELDQIQFAVDGLATLDPALAARLSRRGAVLVEYSGTGDLRAALERASKFMPNAVVQILADPEQERETARIAKEAGAPVRLPQAGASWAATIWADFCALTGSEALVGLTTQVDAAPQVDDETAASAEHVAPVRDEERRRQQQDENQRLQDDETGAMIPSKLSVEEMIERCVLVADGRRVAYVTEDRSLFLKFNDFLTLTIESKTEIEQERGGSRGNKIEKKLHTNANLWLNDVRRASALVPTFHAGAPIITADPEWRRAVNTWRPIKRWPAKADTGAFLDQVDFLFPDKTEREVFLDWLAHIEQKPGELPHYGWLHIAKNTGTGRNWIASVLARVFRGYVAPNVDLAALLDSQFNDELSGRVLAIVDEVQEGASEGNYRHAERLKSMVNVEKRPVNIKYGGKHLEHNACRWLVFSNHENALPLNDKDRRFRVMMHEAPPRPPEVYERLYVLLQDPEFINAVGMFLRERDISRFKPGERPPMNAAKLAAIAASKPMSTQNAEEIVACWPADIITYKHAASLLTGDPEETKFPPGLRRAMEEAGAVTWRQDSINKIKLNGSAHRIWVLRNHARWLGETNRDEIRWEVERASVDDKRNPAASVLADAADALERPPQDDTTF